jgi:outer membrane protein assembly factor BamB
MSAVLRTSSGRYFRGLAGVLLLGGLLFALCGLVVNRGATAADWPMWRYDARRSAASPQELAETLHLQWVREYPPLKPGWPDQPKMQLDAAYDPVILGRTLFVGSSRHDGVTALDTRTGSEKWHFTTDGPVRFAPACWRDRVYFTSDDGHLYCVDAAKGSLCWKVRGAPADRRILGNERLISTWPARGAPVVADGTVYFAASIWPFMGIFIHAVDADTGKAVWTNDGDGAIYIKQPHNVDSFAGVAPQGPLVVLGDRLLIPGGRSVPACYDRHSGKLLAYKLGENGKRGGGSDVSAVGGFFFNGGAVFDLATQKHLGDLGKQMVHTEDFAYSYDKGRVRAYDLKRAAIKTEKKPDKKGKLVEVSKWLVREVGSCDVADVDVLIKAGARLYAGGKGHVTALALSTDEDTPSAVTWQASVPGTVVRLAAADDRLFAVTLEGKLYCFGAAPAQPRIHKLIVEAPAPSPAWGARAEKILTASGVREGYCVVWGLGSGELIAELIRRSDLRVIAVDPDEKKVQAFRERMMAAGHYGERVAAHVGDPATFPLPPYLASLMVTEDLAAAGGRLGPDFLKKIFPELRPYGGVACLALSSDQEERFPRMVGLAALPGARVRSQDGLMLLVREGALPGSADWTHEHADAANTRVSKDKLVKAPLGMLWFGGPSHDGILPRHGHGPQPQVVDGRLIIEGVDLLRALDIYTGRLLWETRLPGVGQFYNNLFHQPGANAAGTNYISTADGIYVAYGQACLRLDPATGKKTAELRLPVLAGMEAPARWGYLNVADDYLVGGADPIFDPKLLPTARKDKSGKPATGDDADPTDAGGRKGTKENPLTKLLKKVVSTNDNLSSSKHLVLMDRQTGKVLWSATARYGFRHNATCIGGGRLYAIDRLSGPQLFQLKRRGEAPEHGPRLVAFDLKTGNEVWHADEGVFGTWLSYSARHDVLVESGRVARDTISDEPKGMRAYRAGTGKLLWDQPKYVGPAMIHGDMVLKDGSACHLLTGAPKMRADPLTGELVEWTWSRNYGCNTPAASENLLTFRSGAAGFLDYCNDGGTGNLGGFRSSCTNNLIVADGVLSAPEYTRTCSCSYQNQTSLGLIHMPEAELWTFFGPGVGKGPVRRLGINLGAPGDRRADNGTLWVEYPSVAGKSPTVPVAIRPAKLEWFRRHSSQVSGPLPWVAASGVKGLETLHVTLDHKPTQERQLTVRLYFMEPDGLKPGQRLFHVALQGREVWHDLDVAREAGGANRSLVKEIHGVRVTRDLRVRLTPSVRAERAETVLCGVEIMEEPPAR